MACHDGCNNAKSFVQLRADLQLAERDGYIQHVPLELLLAVAVKESRGRRWFSEKDLQYRENIVVAMRATGKTSRQLIDELNEPVGNLKGEIIKFRYEPYFNKIAKRMLTMLPEERHWEFRLSCSIGYFQKAMCFHLGAKAPREWSEAYRKFVIDVNEQIRVCDNDLRVLIAGTHGDVALALTRYNGPSNAKVVSEYGKQVFALYESFLDEHKQGEHL